MHASEPGDTFLNSESQKSPKFKVFLDVKHTTLRY